MASFLTPFGLPHREGSLLTLHAVAVLQKCLSDVFQQMHAARTRVLLGAVAALICSRRLILMELARAWPGASRVRAPLKRLDRLLGNAHLIEESERCYAAMARWLVRGDRPILVIDWSDLKTDGSLHLLRAGIPVGGRTLTVLETIHPEREKNSARVERAFLRRLKALLPPAVKPILVTDAGFRAPWFRAVTKLGWDYVGRVRHRTYVQLAEDGGWITNRSLHTVARPQPKRFTAARLVRNAPWQCDLILVRKPRRGRKALTRRGQRARSRQNLKAAQSAREPWLLATSLTEVSHPQIVAIYAKRMQIEESFRDLKCDRYGCAVGDSLTRRDKRLAVLLLLHALATFVAWLSALTGNASSVIRYGGIVSQRPRRHYSLLRIGWEALRQRWTQISTRDLWCVFTQPPQWWLAELGIPE
ncbi:MAG: IS4 family transposase [Gammaproteobacteria bacterium]|nr:IS4 family transposase [Gammaproteobacteria bacterium]